MFCLFYRHRHCLRFCSWACWISVSCFIDRGKKLLDRLLLIVLSDVFVGLYFVVSFSHNKIDNVCFSCVCLSMVITIIIHLESFSARRDWIEVASVNMAPEERLSAVRCKTPKIILLWCQPYIVAALSCAFCHCWNVVVMPANSTISTHVIM